MKFVALLALIVGVFGAQKSYQGYKVLQLGAAKEEEYAALLDVEDVEVLTEGAGSMQLLVSPKKLSQIEELLEDCQISYTVVVENFQDSIKLESSKVLRTSPLVAGTFSYDAYHSIAEMYAHLDALATDYPDKVRVFSLPGKTYEGREIKVIKISENVSKADGKPIIWLDGGIHAREWVSPATVMYIIDSLVGLEEKNKATKMGELLKTYQFLIAPDINPDGYEYSRNHDRMWRKTRKPSGCKYNYERSDGFCYYGKCYGVDPNRNWDSDWARQGVSTNPCSNVYPGKAPFDQNNTRMVKTFLETVKSDLVLYVTYHSYSQLFLTPLGYTTNIDATKLRHHKKVGAAVVKAIKDRHGMEYINKQSASLYPASGDSADWAYEKLKCRDSYTFELRPNNAQTGFLLPSDQIRATGEENVDGLLALIDNLGA